MNMLVLALLLWMPAVLAAPADDLVENLPGLNFTPSFKSYSGYLVASDTKRFHYWFTKAERNPDSAPVLLWLNGGPGCSSLGGLIEELGPFHVSDYGNTVYHNPYAWNKVGNVIFLESPAGVGFSYDSTHAEATDDDKVAEHNYNALVDFFTNKFPEYRNNDFFITGESYGGIYVPTLAVLVAADKKNFPYFRGIAVGNGIYSFPLNTNTMVPLMYYHGLVRQVLYDKTVKTCCNGNSYNCDYNSATGECARLVNQLTNQGGDLDPYNLYNVCYLDQTTRSKRTYIRDQLLKRAGLKPSINKAGSIESTSLPLCAQTNNTEAYLNRHDVRKALHIPSFVPYWSDCTNSPNFDYSTLYSDVKAVFLKLIQQKVRILTYNGDVDTVCNFALNTKFIDSLGLQLADGGLDSTEWFYHKETPSVAGFQTKYTNNVHFLTVRGSGHFVPEDKPREALQMIYNFIHQRDYSLPVPF